MSCLREDKKATTKLGSVAESIWKKTKEVTKFILPAKKRVKQKESKKFVDDMQSSSARQHGHHAFFAKMMIDMLKWKPDMTTKESKTMYEKMTTASGDVNWNSIADVIRGRYNEAVKKWTDDKSKLLGKIVPYFPRVLTKEVREVLQHSLAELRNLLDAKSVGTISDEVLSQVLQGKALRQKGFKASKNVEGFEGKPVLISAVEHLRKQSGGKLSIRDALLKLETDMSGDLFMDVPFTKTRKLELPSSFYEQDVRIVLPRYIEGMSRRIAEIEEFGVGSERVLRRLEAIEKVDFQEAQFVKEMLTKWSGTYQLQHAPTGKLRRAIDAYVGFEVATKIGLGRGTLLNFTQWAISFMPKLGFYNSVRAGMDLTSAKFRERLKRSGIIDQIDIGAIQALTGEIPGGFFGKAATFTTKWSGFTAVNKANLYWAASTFLRAQTQWRKQAQGTGRLAELRRKQLKDIGIDYKKEMSKEELNRAMFTFATNSQLLKNVLEEPLWFNDPKIAPFLLFKRFGYRQAAMMSEMITKEVKRGNVAPVIRMAVAGYAGGAMALWGLDKIKEMLSGEPQYQTEDRFLRKAIDHMAVIGSFGMLGDLLELKKSSELWEKFKFSAFPVVMSDFIKLGETHTKVMQDWERYGDGWLATKKNAYRAFGFFGSYPNYASKRLKTEGQKEGGVRFLKGKERTAIFEDMLDGRSESASNKIALWNKHHPSSAFSFSDVSIGALNKYLQRKLRAKVGVENLKDSPEFKKKVREGQKEVREKIKKVREGQQR